MGLRHTFQKMVLTMTTYSSILNVPVLSRMVYQPPALTVMAGDTAVMVCMFENKMRWDSRAWWVKNSTGNTNVDVNNTQYSGRLTMSSQIQRLEGKAIMNISNVSSSDSDIYYCEIELFNKNTDANMIGKGNGTQLTVIEDQAGRRNQIVPVSSRTVYQPPALTVMAGDTAVMVCMFENTMRWDSRAWWVKNSTGNTNVDLNNTQYSGRLTLSSQTQCLEGKAIMNISNVSGSDSDIYYCEIELFNKNTDANMLGKGNGTQLTVIEDQAGRRNQSQTDAASTIQMMTRSLVIRSILAFLLITGGLLGCYLTSHIEIHREEEMEDLPH